MSYQESMDEGPQEGVSGVSDTHGYYFQQVGSGTKQIPLLAEEMQFGTKKEIKWST